MSMASWLFVIGIAIFAGCTSQPEDTQPKPKGCTDTVQVVSLSIPWRECPIGTRIHTKPGKTAKIRDGITFGTHLVFCTCHEESRASPETLR